MHSYQYLLYITGQYGTVHSEIIIYPYGVLYGVLVLESLTCPFLM